MCQWIFKYYENNRKYIDFSKEKLAFSQYFYNKSTILLTEKNKNKTNE